MVPRAAATHSFDWLCQLANISLSSDGQYQARNMAHTGLANAATISEDYQMQCKGFLIGACTALLFSSQALAEPPRIIAPGTGQDLGSLSSNPFDPNSVRNPYGAGNPYKPDSVTNPFGRHGNPHSPNSVTNPYAMDTPVLVDPTTGKYLGKVSSNPFDPDSISNPHGRYGSRYSPDSVNNPYGRYGSQYSPNSASNPYATSSPRFNTPGRVAAPPRPAYAPPAPTWPSYSRPQPPQPVAPVVPSYRTPPVFPGPVAPSRSVPQTKPYGR